MPISTARALAEIDQFLSFWTVVRASGEVVAGPKTLSKKARTLERRLVNILTTQWQESAEGAAEAAAAVVLTGSGKVSEVELDAILASVQQKLGPSFAGNVLADSSEVLKSSYQLGRSLFERTDKKPKAVSFNLVDQRAVDWLQKDHQYWIGSFYDRSLGEKIASSVKTSIIEQGLGRKAAGKELEKVVLGMTLDRDVVGKKGYWEGLAAVAATRARTFGAIEGMVAAEITEFEFLAVMDERTSDVCRQMNGRIFSVSAAVDLRDRILDAKSPEDVKSITPWVQPGKVQGTPSKNLQDQGVCMPPAHFRCRSTVVATFQSDAAMSFSTPTGASKRTKAAFGVLEPGELSNKLTLNRIDPQHMPFDAEERMFTLHAKDSVEFRIPPKTKEEYRENANELIRTAFNIFGRGDVRHGRVYQYVEVNKKQTVTATDSGKILSYVGYNHLPTSKWNKIVARYRKTHVEIRDMPKAADIDAATIASVHPEVKK